MHNKPDLGVWNCGVCNTFDDESLGSVLKNVVLKTGDNISAEEEKKDVVEDANKEVTTNTVVLTVHLGELNEVQPTLERMRNVIVSAYGDERLVAGKGTTSIKTLQSCLFGKALIKQEVNPNQTSGGKIALILAAVVSSSKQQGNASTEYQERQKQLLVVYHLHKFALEVNCTLCFVRDYDIDAAKGVESSSQIPSMTIEELAHVIRRVAMGLPPLDENAAAFEESFSEKEQTEATPNQDSVESAITSTSVESTNPSIYPPGSHDAGLIFGAMQRNASCVGLWDTSKDDLEVALPPSTSKGPAKDNTVKETTVGDEEWLSKLASSVGITIDTTKDNTDLGGAAEETKTPVERKKEALKKKKSSKTVASKSEKAPSDFFANLLKK